MKIIGYRKADFTTKDGVEVTGYNAYIATEIDPRYGKGDAVERVYLSDAKIAREGIDLAKLMGKEAKIYYNRYGKVDSIVAHD